MNRRNCQFLMLLLSSACGRQLQPADAIPGIPANQQRVITRNELGWRWPFTVGTGTVGCAAGRVVFRAGGLDYTVSGPPQTGSGANVESIRLTYSGWPSDPLSRIRQSDRQTIFAEAAGCETTSSPAATRERCRQRLRERAAITEAELQQIEVEGRERTWPPLPPTYVTLDPVIEAGLTLCGT